MTKNLFHKKFDPNAEYVARRAFGDYAPGDRIVKKDFTDRRIAQFYSTRMIVMEDVWKKFVAGPSPQSTQSLPAVDPAPVDSGETHPLDHDGDGNPGGSKPASERNLDDLRNQLEALGVNVDRRWGEKRLNEELEKATAPAPTLPGVSDGAA